MCGRFVTTSAVADLAERLHIDEVRDVEDVPNYNVTPRTEVLVVAQTADHARVLDRVRWGLVPSWAKDVKVGDKLINARAETISEKVVREIGLECGLVDNKVCAVDETWSGLRFVFRSVDRPSRNGAKQK
jgi:hypothetical protein